MGATRVVVDTCVVRGHIHSDGALLADWAPLVETGTIAVSIPDTCVAELLLALLEERISWADWRARVPEISSLLDPAMPVLPGNRELAYMVGLSTNAKAYEIPMETQSRAMWAALLQAENREDLGAPFDVTSADGSTISVSLGVAQAKEIVEEFRDYWFSYIRVLWGSYCIDPPSGPEIDRIVSEGALQLFGGSEANCARIDAMVRLLSRYAKLAIQSKTPYNAESERNRGDWFDYLMLMALGLPAVLCTTDTRLIDKVTETGSTQASLILTPEQLLTAAQDGALASIVSGEPSSA